MFIQQNREVLCDFSNYVCDLLDLLQATLFNTNGHYGGDLWENSIWFWQSFFSAQYGYSYGSNTELNTVILKDKETEIGYDWHDYRVQIAVNISDSPA